MALGANWLKLASQTLKTAAGKGFSQILFFSRNIKYQSFSC